MIQRNLDGVYFRVCRDGKWVNVCYSDLTNEEKQEVMKGKDEKWLRSLCVVLGERIREIGDTLDLVLE